MGEGRTQLLLRECVGREQPEHVLELAGGLRRGPLQRVEAVLGVDAEELCPDGIGHHPWHEVSGEGHLRPESILLAGEHVEDLGGGEQQLRGEVGDAGEHEVTEAVHGEEHERAQVLSLHSHKLELDLRVNTAPIPSSHEAHSGALASVHGEHLTAERTGKLSLLLVPLCRGDGERGVDPGAEVAEEEVILELLVLSLEAQVFQANQLFAVRGALQLLRPLVLEGLSLIHISEPTRPLF
jgi:hypothetical protein